VTALRKTIASAIFKWPRFKCRFEAVQGSSFAMVAVFLDSFAQRAKMANNLGGLCVLVADDDLAMGQRLSNFFQERGFRSVCRSHRHVMKSPPILKNVSMVILALRSNQDSDYETLRRIQACDNVPVILIIDRQRSTIDGVLGLERGADDYLEEPVSLAELVVRARAILRRRNIYPCDVPRKRRDDTSPCRLGNLTFDRRARRLIGNNGEVVRLSRREYGLLNAFLDSAGEPLTREMLLRLTRMHQDINDRSIDVQVLRLRRKLKTKLGTTLIQTERGIGYVLAVPELRRKSAHDDSSAIADRLRRKACPAVDRDKQATMVTLPERRTTPLAVIEQR
jgi:DNA-binding response OmpR family regulator